MNIPILKSCDIPKRENQKESFVIHNLSHLVKEDLYIPKIPQTIFFLGPGQRSI